MALEVANMLDAVSFWRDTSDEMLKAINSFLSGCSVAKGYNILVTLAGRSYHFTSDAGGKLVCIPLAPGKPTADAIAKCKVRVVALPAPAGQTAPSDDMEQMQERRRVYVDGDGGHLLKLEEELAPRVMGELAQRTRGIQPSARALRERAQELEGELPPEYPKAVAHLEKGAPEPQLSRISSWLVFTAMSCMMGNMGQSNYTAANIMLDCLTYHSRMARSAVFNAYAFMWGTIGGIGMRWKAFASQDMMLATAESAAQMMDYTEAQECLRLVVEGHSPEMIGAQKYDKATIDFFLSGYRHPNPWGFTKGKGGGDSMAGESDICWTSASAGGSVWRRSERPGPSARSRSGLFQGRRVQLQGLEANADMNGLRGTLVEEVGEGKWCVRMDGDLGDKVLKVKNISTLSGSAEKPKVSGVSLPPPVEYSIGGSWDGWLPHAMEWDAEERCLVFKAKLSSGATDTFQLCKAATSEWKPRGTTYSIISERSPSDAHYKIRLALNPGGSVKKVDWVKVDP